MFPKFNTVTSQKQSMHARQWDLQLGFGKKL